MALWIPLVGKELLQETGWSQRSAEDPADGVRGSRGLSVCCFRGLSRVDRFVLDSHLTVFVCHHYDTSSLKFYFA